MILYKNGLFLGIYKEDNDVLALEFVLSAFYQFFHLLPVKDKLDWNKSFLVNEPLLLVSLVNQNFA